MHVVVFEFEEFRLDADRFELCRAGDSVKLERKPMELLLLLAESGGRLVSRSEIAERLWDSAVYVDTEHGINTAVRKIRQVLRDDPESPRFLQTVTGKGYRFIAAVSMSGVAEEKPAPVAVTPVPEEISALSIAPVRGRAIPVWALAGMGLLLLLVGAGVGYREWLAARGSAAKVAGPAGHGAAGRLVRPEAREAYLKGRDLWFKDKGGEVEQYFRRATELDPSYALGWSGLSVYYGGGSVRNVLDPRQVLEAELATARVSVQLDDTLPEAHLALGSALFLARWDWVGSAREVDRAIELDPKFAEAWHFRSKMLLTLNRPAEAIAAQKTATELDPFARPWALVLAYLQAREYDKALEEADLRLKADANDATLREVLSQVYRSQGRYKEFAAELATGLTLRGDHAGAAAVEHAFGTGGYRAVLHWQLDRLQEKAVKRYVSPVEFAILEAQLGDKEATLSALEEGLRQKAPALLWVGTDPAFDFLRGEARWKAVWRGVGLGA